MSKRKIWVVKLVACNPEIFSDVKIGQGSPMMRVKALEDAKIHGDKGWRSWVEHGKSEAELAFKDK